MRFLWLSLACVLHAQIPTVSFSPQGAELLRQTTGKNIRSFQLVGVMVCSPVALSYSGGQVYSAASSAGVEWRGPEATGLILSRTSDHNWQNTLATFGQFGTITAMGLFSAGVVSVAPRWQSALILAHQGADALLPILRFRAPNPQTLLGLIVSPSSTYSVPAGGCIEGVMGAKFPGPGAVTIPLPGHMEIKP
jgi:hypothetical protein